MQLEVLFLNGQSLELEELVGLEEAKVKAAEVLETEAMAVSLVSDGQVLTQQLLSQLALSQSGSCYAVVDQDRLQMVEVLKDLEGSLQDLRHQSEVVREMRAAWKLRELEMPCLQDSSCDRCIRAAEMSLKEDVLSVQEEKALVLRISKLQRLKSEETALLEARRTRSGMDYQLHRKLLEEKKCLRRDLQCEIQDIIDVRVDSFPQPADEPEYCTPEWVEKHVIRPQMSLGSFDDETLRQVCPRLERRHVGHLGHVGHVLRASKARKDRASEKGCDKVRSRNLGRPGRPGRPGRKERRRSRLDEIRQELEIELC